MRLVPPLSLAAAVLGVALAGLPAAADDPDPAVRTIANPADRGPSAVDQDGDAVTEDLAAQLDDAAPGDRVDVVVTGVGAARAREVVGSFGPSTDFDLITGFGARLTVDQVHELAEDPSVLRVEPDREFTGSDAAGGRDYGATQTREDLGLDGAGVGICVVDNGVLIGHEQFDGDLEAWADFASAFPPVPDPGGSGDLDPGGHGTHVASIALGDGVGADPAKAADGGGVAPAADLYVARVLNQGFASLTSVIAGIEWCVGQAGVDVINMSLNAGPSDGLDAASLAANAAVAAGKVVVVSAGNAGDYPGSVASPGTAADVITVGAASDHSAVIPPLGGTSFDPGLFLGVFSGRGPTLSGLTKPDVVGPGSTVFAAVNTSPTTYGVKTGTSMATPYVAGAVALGLQAVPTATPAQVKSALQASAKDAGMPGKDNEWGAGLVDVRAFVDTLKGVVAPQRTPFPRHQFLRGVLTEAHPVATFELELGPADVNLAVNATGIASGGGILTCPGNVCAFPVWAPRFDMRVYQGNVDGPTSIPPESCASVPRYCESLRQSQLIFSVTDAGSYSVEVSLPPDYDYWKSIAPSVAFSVDVFYGPADDARPGRPELAPTLTFGGSTLSVTNGNAVRLAGSAMAPAAPGGSLVVQWGDGTSSTVPVACSDLTGVCQPFSVPHTYGKRGSFPVSARFTASGESDTAATTAVVANNAPVWVTGAKVSFPAAKPLKKLAAGDADGDKLTFKLSKGKLPTGLTLKSNGKLSRTGVIQAGRFVATISVSDGAGGTVKRKITFTVT